MFLRFLSTIKSIISSLISVFDWKSKSGTLDPKEEEPPATTPTSVNYHFTRKCNYKCGFCFHTAKTSFVLPLEEAKRGLTLLKEAGTITKQNNIYVGLYIHIYF